jgi:dTMP kinase
MSKGKLIVLEGLDGSGKATQSALLAKHLTDAGNAVMQITFPNYASESSALVRMYLGGQFGDKPDDVNAYAASSFYAVDRYAGYKTDWGTFYEQGGILVADRYTTSNAIHQCSKLPPEEWDHFLEWLFDYEFRLLGLPAPDAVIYLSVDPTVSQRLMTGRYHGDESKKDVHEKDVEYLARSRRAAEYCAAHLGWKTIACNQADAMRSIEEIGAEVYAVAQSMLNARTEAAK